MPSSEEEVPESPATWENIIDGEIKEVVGHATGNEALVEQGKEEVEIAHEVREEFREQHKTEPLDRSHRAQHDPATKANMRSSA